MKLSKPFLLAALLVPAAAFAQGYDGPKSSGGASVPNRSSTPGNVIDDSAITAKVKTAFISDREVSSLDIKVVTNDGVVRLSGTAKSQQEADKAVALARNVGGVKDVRNEIQVAPGSPQ